jgi:hypothetical protein
MNDLLSMFLSDEGEDFSQLSSKVEKSSAAITLPEKKSVLRIPSETARSDNKKNDKGFKNKRNYPWMSPYERSKSLVYLEDGDLRVRMFDQKFLDIFADGMTVGQATDASEVGKIKDALVENVSVAMNIVLYSMIHRTHRILHLHVIPLPVLPGQTPRGVVTMRSVASVEHSLAYGLPYIIGDGAEVAPRTIVERSSVTPWKNPVRHGRPNKMRRLAK